MNPLISGRQTSRISVINRVLISQHGRYSFAFVSCSFTWGSRSMNSSPECHHCAPYSHIRREMMRWDDHLYAKYNTRRLFVTRWLLKLSYGFILMSLLYILVHLRNTVWNGIASQKKKTLTFHSEYCDEVSVRTFSRNVSAVNHSRPWWRSLRIHSICKLPLLWFTALLERMRGNFHIPWHNWFAEGGWGEDACLRAFRYLVFHPDYLGLFSNVYILL